MITPQPVRLAPFALASALCLGACVTTDQPENPAEIAAEWSASAPIYEGPVSADGWLRDIPSPQVKSLVREALEHNHDLEAAAARMRVARARRMVEGAERFPQLRAGQDNSRSLSVSPDRLRNRSNDFNLSLNLSWEIDLWGELRDRDRAAGLEAAAEEANYRAARLSLAANTAKAWFNAVETEQQQLLARRTLMSFTENLDIIERAFAAGVDDPGADNALDLRLARANVAAASNQLALAGRNRDSAARALETLLGRYPMNSAKIASELPRLRRQVPAGLPSELLLRRPDLIAAERRLAGSGLRLSAAKKAFLPSINLTARGGSSTPQFSDLLDSDRLVASVIGGIVQPVTEGGRLRGNVALTRAQRDEALHSYAQSTLNAFREVETALAAERYLAAQEDALTTAASESEAAEELAVDQYGRGLVDIITVLSSQRRAFDAKSALIAIRNERLQSRIDLYLALGGEFDPNLPR